MHADFHPNSVLTHRFAQAMAAAACVKEGGFGASQIFGLPEPDYGELIGAILKPASGSCARKGIRPPFAPPTQTTPRNCILSNWAICLAGMTCTAAITAVHVRGVWQVLPGVYLLAYYLKVPHSWCGWLRFFWLDKLRRATASRHWCAATRGWRRGGPSSRCFALTGACCNKPAW